MTAPASTCHRCGALLDPGRSRGRCAACLLADAFAPSLSAGALGKIGEYELLAEIARGGMGVVYRARQLEPAREVALKTLRGAELHSTEARARFRHEAAAMAELEHPAILPIHQFGEQDGIPFFTMQLATGGSLAERIGTFAGQWARIAQLMRTLSEAVHFAHEHGVLHRDLKPANILFDEDGRAYVSDFGLARLASAVDSQLTMASAVFGTPHYLAPEIAARDARAATIASDIWGLGVILYEMLAQARPFHADSVSGILRQITDGEPPAMTSGAPRDLETIARHAMAKEPGRRYASAQELADDLRRWSEGRPILARPISWRQRLILWARRSPVLALLSGATALSLIIGIGGLGWGLQRARRERDSAQEELRNSLLHQARSGRIARIAGWRDAGLGALRRAAAIRKGIDLRDEAIGHLAGFDLKDSTGLSLPKFTAAAPDFESYATFGLTPVLKLHRASDGQKLGEFPAVAKTDALLPHYDPTGRWIAVESAAGDVHLFEVAGRRLLKTWPRARFGGFSSDGERLAIDEWARPARIIRTADQQELGVLPATAVSTPPGALASDPGTSAMALGRAEVIEVWDWQAGQRLKRLATFEDPSTISWHGDWLAAGTRRGDIRLFNLREQRAEVLAEHTSRVSTFVFTPDGTLLATSSYDGTAVLWHTDSGELLVRSRQIYPRAFNRDGTRFLHGGAQGYGWGEVQCPSAVRYFSDRIFGRAESHLDISPDGRWLVDCGGPGFAIFELGTGRLLATEPLKAGRIAQFTADGRHLIVSGNSFVGLWSLAVKEGRLVTQFERDLTPAGARSLEVTFLSPDRRWLGAAVDGNRAGVLDCETLVDWAWLPIAARPIFVTPASGGRWVAAGAFNEDGLRLWDRENPAKSRRLNIGNVHPWFSPDGRWLADGGTQKTRIYDSHTGQVVHEEDNDSATDVPHDLAWSPDNRYLAVIKHRNLVCLLDTATWQIAAVLNSPLQHPVSSMRFAPDGRTLAVSRQTGGLEVWDLTQLAAELAALGLPWQLSAPGTSAPIPPDLGGEVEAAELPPLFGSGR